MSYQKLKDPEFLYMKFTRVVQIGAHSVTTVSCSVDDQGAPLQEIIGAFETFLLRCDYKVSLSYLIQEEPVDVSEN